MVNFISKLFGKDKSKDTDKISVNDLNNYSPYSQPIQTDWDGDKFFGGFGITKDYDIVDFCLLRKRSKQLFTENLYARGLIRRLLTNEINKGLALEATPDNEILQLDQEFINNWTEKVERLFSIWGKNPKLCDYKKLETFGAIQRQARMMALLSGDVLVVQRIGRNGLPNIDLIDADCVVDPLNDQMYKDVKARGNKICDGVEIDSTGRHIAFFIESKEGGYKRIPAYGARTGRKQAWLLYGTEKLHNHVRGQPLLALVIQSLKEVDRFRDAELRSAVVNSMIAMWIKKDEDKISSLPISSGATRKDTITTQDDSQGRKDVQFSTNLPGMIFQELQQGESPVSYDTTRPNINFGTFESAVISSIAWANEIPPESLVLSFNSNYSASRGAVQEFKIYLNKVRTIFGEQFLDPIYQEFLLSNVLAGNIETPMFLESRNDQTRWFVYGAWLGTDWNGAIKPNVDLLKEVKAYKEMIDGGLITRERASRELNGMKYSKIYTQLAKENQQLAEALDPLIQAGLVKDENPQLEDSIQGE